MIGFSLALCLFAVFRYIIGEIELYNQHVKGIEAINNPETTRILPGDRVEFMILGIEQ